MRRALTIGVPALLLATLAWYFVVYSPAGQRVVAAEDALGAASDEELQLQTQLVRLRKIQDNEFAYLEAIGVIEGAIPSDPELDVIIEDLHELANQTGVAWLSVANGVPAEVEGERYFEFPMTINVEAQYFELLGYLYGIADLSRLVTIDGLDVSSRQDEDGFTILTVSIDARVYTTSDLIVPDFGIATTTTTTSTTVPAEDA